MTTLANIVNRAMDHHRHGRVPEAEAGYRDALRRDPNNADALHLLGLITAQRGDLTQGGAMIERALKYMPSSPEAHFNLANILVGLSRFADADRHFRTAFDLRPNADAANGAGGCLLRLGRYDEAEPWLKQAITLDPRCVNALVNMGTFMDAVGRFDETIPCYDRALAIEPDHILAHQNRALALLVRGRLDEGWREYAWRFKTSPAFYGHFPIPTWRGEKLGGQKILVWTEQGLGDEILVLSMVPDLINAGARVVLICSPRLCELCEKSFPGIDVIPRGEQPRNPAVKEGIVFQASVSDLGQYLRPSFGAFPARQAYLKPDESLAKTLREKYKAHAGANRLVGIAWRSKAPDGGAEKTISLQEWAAVLQTPGVTFVNLQYGDTAGDVAAVERDLGVKILDDRDIDPLANLAPVASQIAALDLTITVSSTTAHAAGAIGAEGWTLIPSNSGRLWYWFLERQDSPWYPSLRLFRQRDSGWAKTMAEVASALASSTPTKSAE